MRLYWIDTKWACGGIWVKNKIVYEGAPISILSKGYIRGRLQDLEEDSTYA